VKLAPLAEGGVAATGKRHAVAGFGQRLEAKIRRIAAPLL
jgi:hypothetical protein